MTRMLAYASFLLLAAAPVLAQISFVSAQPEPAAPEEIKVVRLTIRPAGVPVPALKYQLLPDFLDQEPGNAATLYATALQLFAPQAKEDLSEKVASWLEMPLKDLPRDAIRSTVGEHQNALRYVRLASRREHCRWDHPIRSEGFNVLLPSLSPLRGLAKLLAVRARLEIAEGRYDDAVATLQTGFAMARHIGEGPTLIESLVDTAVGSLMADRVQELTQAADSPNLYWALSGLPRPFVDLHGSIRYEMSCVYLAIPQLRNLRTADLSLPQWQALDDEVGKLLDSAGVARGGSSQAWGEKLVMAAATIKAYPKAKQYLISLGRSPQQIEDMPAQQVVMIYSLDCYTRWRDDLFKWFGLPYWQAHEGLVRTEQVFSQWEQRVGDGYPFTRFLPSVHRAYFLATKLDRRIAAQRCIEAIRAYAAAHDGRPPASLREITETPVAADPVTGTDFGYTVAGSQMTLEAPAPRGESLKEGTRYEITLSK